MANFSVTNNIYLRQVYAPNRALSVSANRTTADSKTLIAADTNALGKAIKAMGSLDFKTDTTKGKETFFNTLKSFTDAYNYTVSSSGSTKNKKMSTLTDGLKKLTSKYESELKGLGLSIKDGYLKLSSNAKTTVSPSEYEEMFGKDSKFMKELSAYAKKINKSIDVAL